MLRVVALYIFFALVAFSTQAQAQSVLLPSQDAGEESEGLLGLMPKAPSGAPPASQPNSKANPATANKQNEQLQPKPALQVARDRTPSADTKSATGESKQCPGGSVGVSGQCRPNTASAPGSANDMNAILARLPPDLREKVKSTKARNRVFEDKPPPIGAVFSRTKASGALLLRVAPLNYDVKWSAADLLLVAQMMGVAKEDVPSRCSARIDPLIITELDTFRGGYIKSGGEAKIPYGGKIKSIKLMTRALCNVPSGKRPPEMLANIMYDGLYVVSLPSGGMASCDAPDKTFSRLDVAWLGGNNVACAFF